MPRPPPPRSPARPATRVRPRGSPRLDGSPRTGRAHALPDGHRSAAAPRRGARERLGDDELWAELFERPLGAMLRSSLDTDLARGIALTDGLIGTFASADDESLRQNRCFLYHVIGGGTGDWDVPVGGMGRVSGELERAAREAGAELRTGAEVTAVTPDGEVRRSTTAPRRSAAGWC